MVYAEILETNKGGAEESSIKEAPKVLRNQGPEEQAQTFTQRTSLHPALHRIPFRATGATGEPLTLLVCCVKVLKEQRGWAQAPAMLTHVPGLPGHSILRRLS